MPPSPTQPGVLSHSLPNDNLLDWSSVYSYDSSFGMDSPQDFPPGPSRPSHRQATKSSNRQSNIIDLGGVQTRESLSLSGTPDRSKNQPALYQVPSSTPVIRRIASYRHYLPSAAPKRGNVSAREMGTYLAIELDGLRPTKIVDLPNIIFPDSCLPFTVDETLLQQLGDVWDAQKKVLFPPVAYTEVAVQNWFNAIANNITSVTNIHLNPPRFWSAQFCNNVLPNNELQRKPDIVLIKNMLTPFDWRSVHGVAEVTSRSKLHADMMRTINNKTYLMFCTQHNRRFVPFLAVCSRRFTFLSPTVKGRPCRKSVIVNRENTTLSVSYASLLPSCLQKMRLLVLTRP